MKQERLSFADFQNEIGFTSNSSLEELAGGVLGACHPEHKPKKEKTLQDSIHDFLDDLFNGGIT